MQRTEADAAVARGIPRPVRLLGWASFFTDTASEAIYPLLPLFLTRTLGASALALGLIEGVADAAASVLRIVSGRLSDRWGVRRPIVIAGYGLSGAVRPLIALVTAWPQVLALRFTDRVGKGMRGAPRDAMLARLASDRTRGRVFGFQRAMDHAGAVTGPLIASLFLLAYPEQYRTLFALTIVPGVLVILILLRVPETADGGSATRADGRASDWRHLPGRFYGYLAVILLFTLGNSTDAFLLLKLSQAGVSPAWIPVLWSALHVVKAGSAFPGGALADRWNRRTVIALGWLVYAAVYAGLAVSSAALPVVMLFLVYGFYFGLSEGPERALVADLAPGELRGTAFGLYSAATGLGALAASVLFGLLWEGFGPAAAFATGAALAALAAVLLLALPRRSAGQVQGTWGGPSGPPRRA